MRRVSGTQEIPDSRTDPSGGHRRARFRSQEPNSPAAGHVIVGGSTGPSSDQALREVMDAIPHLVITFDASGDLTSTNRHWTEYTGMALDQHREWRTAVHREDVDALDGAWGQARAGVAACAVDCRIRTRDGAYRWNALRFAPVVRDATLAYWVATGTDIDDRRRAGETLRSLAESMPALVIMVRRDGSVDYCNERMLAYSGRTQEWLSDGGWAKLMHPEDVERGQPLFESRLSSERPFRAEYRVLRHDGAYRWHLGNIAPLRQPDGEIVAWLGVAVDIDDRKRVEDRQRFLAEAGALLGASLEYEATLASLVRLAVPQIADICALDVIIDGDHLRRMATICADPQKQKLVEGLDVRSWRAGLNGGGTVGEAVAAGKSLFMPDLTQDDVAAMAGGEQEMAAALGCSSAMLVPLTIRRRVIGVLSFGMAESGRRYERSDLALAEDLAARAAIAIENARLFRDMQNTADELRLANEAKDEFLGLVSHELRTPITTIYGNAHILRKNAGHLSASDEAIALSDIESESGRLQQIIDNMFVLARAGMHHDVPFEPILVDRALRKIIAEHQRRHPNRVINLQVEPGLLPACAETTYFEQIVRNLLNNAEKYSKDGSAIDVDVTGSEEGVAIRVSDRGSGITVDEAARLFTPFYRSDRTSDRASGAGMGLAVCRRLVEAQSGRIWATEREGGGAEFGFSLPVDREAYA